MTLRFFAGGGMPPQSHEVLRLQPDGSGVYLTAMPWPDQEPFDEIGVYEASGDYARLASAARAAIAVPPQGRRLADAGGESITIDGVDASWSPRARSPEAAALVSEVRAVIGAARERPVAAARTHFDGGHLLLIGIGSRDVLLSHGEVRAGWGPADHVASPLALAHADPTPVELPFELAPGTTVPLPLPEPRPADDDEFTTLNALVHVRWRPHVDGEPDELDGWMIAGASAG